MNFLSSYYFKIFVRIFILLALCIIILVTYQEHLYYSAAFLVLLILVLLTEIYYFSKKHYGNIDRIVLAMIHDDFSLKSDKEQSNPTLQNLQSLYKKLQQEQQKNEIKELVYLNILNNIETGIIILEQKKEQWDVFFINDYFAKYFDIPKIKSWNNLVRLLPGLGRHLQDYLHFKESKGAIDIQIENEEKQTFLLQTSVTKSNNQTFFIVLLDSIQRVLDKKERDAWQSLMKIISHEIMNSLAPIHSLAHNTKEILEENQLSREDWNDIKISVETIVNRTNHLQNFIENYRKLTLLPAPKKEVVTVQSVLQNSIHILLPMLQQQQIHLRTYFESDIQTWWDKQQMEQVFINILTNAVFAVKNEEKKEIAIQTTVQNNRLLVEFIDSGKGIPDEIKDKIFIPFYTTRENGAGIGLPLSKNIVEMHNGYLTYLRKNNQTHFVVNFPVL